MEYRTLGRTGLEVSAIGLGTEHLRGQPRDTVVTALREAVDCGINYFDVIFAMPDYLDHLRESFQGHRDRVLLTSHLGSTERGGQYYKTRTAKRCKASFLGVLQRLDTDYVDVLLLHNFNTVNDWERASRSGYLDLAVRLREEGRARFLGISGHYPEVMSLAVAEGIADLLMFPINLFNHAMPGRTDLLDLCLKHNVGVVAMKPFGGGKLLNQRGTVRVPKYQAAGEAYKTRIPDEVGPVQCLSYVLAQPGVSMALPGVKNRAELAEALQTLEATAAERDFGGLLAEFGRYVEGECTYCNHCLPCPVVIDIGLVTRLLDLAEGQPPEMANGGPTADLRAMYQALPVKASACTECGACTKRCPFGVDVVANVQRAVAVFETDAREENL
jgi:predicted aldo/keto reductase-like oxidoreductase